MNLTSCWFPNAAHNAVLVVSHQLQQAPTLLPPVHAGLLSLQSPIVQLICLLGRQVFATLLRSNPIAVSNLASKSRVTGSPLSKTRPMLALNLWSVLASYMCGHVPVAGAPAARHCYLGRATGSC
jgi:hypothetical protein